MAITTSAAKPTSTTDIVALVEDKPAPGATLRRVTEPMGGGRVVSAALGGLVSTGLWIGMFTAGIAVPSQPFRDGLLSIAASAPPPNAYAIAGPMDALRALVIIAFCYTPTNLAMLCCLAALVGCLASTATNPPPKQAVAGDASAIPLRPAMSAVTWGFFIYLFMISGMLLAVENPFASTSPDQYLRLAGTASLLAFVVGWRPELVAKLITQVSNTRFVEQGQRPSSGA